MTPLPIDEFLPEIVRAAGTARSVVLVAPPGAGKTTRVPPAILAANLLAADHPTLVMLQPRRVAARAAAARIAEENNWQLGRQVGYHVRFERRLSASTRLRVLTEGILTRQLMDDPFLDGVGAVILDEFHERSIHTDLTIALLREVKQTVRSDLVLIVMSATVDAEPVARFLGGCPIIHSPGKLFDVKIEHRSPTDATLEQRIANEVNQAAGDPDGGDILVFLPGAREINQSQRLLNRDDLLVLPLHGSLPFEQQIRALQPAAKRKVILATNIAETSLTIPGVRTVIDSGLARQAAYDSQRGLDQLYLKRISRASATQRSGRAGRTAPGRCIRLWTAKEHAAMEDFDPPEIRRVDLSSTILALHAWGKSDPLAFPWYERPSEQSVLAAERLLWLLGALDDRKITPLGKRMLELPVHPRLARLLIAAADAGLTEQGAAIAALLSEPDFPSGGLPASVHGDSDLLIRLEQPLPPQTTRLKDDLLRLISRNSQSSPSPGTPGEGRGEGRQKRRSSQGPHPRPLPDYRERELLKLILLAYPDRVARRRPSNSETAVMVGGGGLRIARESVVKTAEFFIAVEARQDDRGFQREALVRIASAIDPTCLSELFPHLVERRRGVTFDSARQKVVGITQTNFLDLNLTEGADAAVDPAEAGKLLASILVPKSAEILARDKTASRLLARIEFLRKWMPEHPWPALDAAQLIEESCAGKRSVDELNPTETIRAGLNYPLDRLLDEHAPEAMDLPSGKRVRLKYEPGRNPVLSARLQEFFGWKQTPRLAAGRVPVLLELLGPNYRPVQITDDLASFWKNTYLQVRKDLRRRYPKHAWPEEPEKAESRRAGTNSPRKDSGA
jgi:ATP-dependent helicase HrpB